MLSHLPDVVRLLRLDNGSDSEGDVGAPETEIDSLGKGSIGVDSLGPGSLVETTSAIGDVCTPCLESPISD